MYFGALKIPILASIQTGLLFIPKLYSNRSGLRKYLNVYKYPFEIVLLQLFRNNK